MTTPTIPNLPTDNLYKFMALFGLTILILTAVLYMTIIDKLKYESIDLENKWNKEIKILIMKKFYYDEEKRAKSDYDSAFILNKKLQLLKSSREKKRELEFSVSSTKMKTLDDSIDDSKIAYKNSLKQLAWLQNDRDSTMKYLYNLYTPYDLGTYSDYQLSSYNVDSTGFKKAEILHLASRQKLSLYDGLCKIGYCTGCMMVIIGFLLWYSKHQIYIDFLLKQEAIEKGYGKKVKKN